MGFGKFIHSVSKFGKKIPGEINHFGGKVLTGLEKSAKIGGKVLDIADKAAGALESVPVIGEVAGMARPLIKTGEQALNGANNGLRRANNINNKIGRMKF